MLNDHVTNDGKHLSKKFLFTVALNSPKLTYPGNLLIMLYDDETMVRIVPKICELNDYYYFITQCFVIFTNRNTRYSIQ